MTVTLLDDAAHAFLAGHDFWQLLHRDTDSLAAVVERLTITRALELQAQRDRDLAVWIANAINGHPPDIPE